MCNVGPVRKLRGATRAGARRCGGPVAAGGGGARQGAAALAAQVRLQRGREVRHARHAQRARAPHRRVVRIQRQVSSPLPAFFSSSARSKLKSILLCSLNNIDF